MSPNSGPSYAAFLTACVLQEATDDQTLFAALAYAAERGLLERDRGDPEEHELALDLAMIEGGALFIRGGARHHLQSCL